MLSELEKEIEMVLAQFRQEELGNRFTQFSFLGLRETIISVVRKHKITSPEPPETKESIG